jgi:hypothetical protein
MRAKRLRHRRIMHASQASPHKAEAAEHRGRRALRDTCPATQADKMPHATTLDTWPALRQTRHAARFTLCSRAGRLIMVSAVTRGTNTVLHNIYYMRSTHLACIRDAIHLPRDAAPVFLRAIARTSAGGPLGVLCTDAPCPLTRVPCWFTWITTIGRDHLGPTGRSLMR